MHFFAIAVTLMGKFDIRTALTQTSTKKQCVGRCRRTAQHNRMNEQQAKCRKLFFFFKSCQEAREQCFYILYSLSPHMF